MKRISIKVATPLMFAVLTIFAFPAYADTSLTKLLPASVRESGILRVAANDSSAPMLYVAKDAHTLEGMEVDLTRAVADALGVKLEMVRGTFDSLIPAISSGRADLAVGAIGDLRARQTQVDFVDYVKAGIGMAVLKGSGAGITNLASLCGKKVAVIRGTYQERELTAQNEKCQASGSSLDVQTFSDPSGTVMALRSGRADVWSGDSSVVGYAVAKSPNQLDQVGEMRPIALLGYAINKQNTQLRDAVKAALDQLRSNGKYIEILKKWGQESTAVDKISINDAWF